LLACYRGRFKDACVGFVVFPAKLLHFCQDLTSLRPVTSIDAIAAKIFSGITGEI